MRNTLPYAAAISLLAVVLVAMVGVLAVAQEAPERRRPRREPPPTFIERPGLEQNQEANRFFGGESEASEEPTFSNELKGSIALTLWILTVEEPDQVDADELSANLAERVDNLEPVIGSISNVQKLVGQMKVAGVLRNAREYRLITLSGQTVSAQRGRNQPRVVASATDPRAGRMNTITMEPLGTLVELQPRIDSDRNIEVRVKIGESELAKSTEVVLTEPADGSPEYADVVTTRQFNTTVSLKNNTAVLLQSVVASGAVGSADDETELIILGAAVVPAADE